MGTLKSILRPMVPRWLRETTYPFRERLGRIPSNLLCKWRIFWRIRVKREVILDLSPFEARVYSQNGEDGIIEAIFASVGTTNRYFVEFGVEDGLVCNTRRLLRSGWSGLQMDPRRNRRGVVEAFVTAENVNELFKMNGVPPRFDLLSIDIDGNDYWAWKAVTSFHPRVVVIEYNASIPPDESRTIVYDPSFRWDGTDYFGAGLLALSRLGRRKGYTLVGCESQGVNAFFVHDSLIEGHFVARTAEELYRPLGDRHRGGIRPSTGRRWQVVEEAL